MKLKLHSPNLSVAGWFIKGIELIIYTGIILSGYVPPEFHYFFSIISFGIPLLVLWFVIITIFYFIKKNKLAIFYLILLFITINVYGGRFFRLNFGDSPKQSLKVLNYNLGAFKSRGPIANLDNLVSDFLSFVQEREVDVLCFQEFSFVTYNLTKELHDLGYKEILFAYPDNEHRKVRSLIFTRLPVVRSDLLIRDNETVDGVSVDISYEGSVVRVINSHITSFNIKSKHPLTKGTLNEGIHAVRDILERLKITSHYQLDQVEDLITKSSEEEDVVFCGDFNTIPSSYLYTRIKKDFDNAFEKAGHGFGFTYLGKTLFFLRLDNQFYKGKLKCTKLRNINFGFSDHKAVYGEYSLIPD